MAKLRRLEKKVTRERKVVGTHENSNLFVTAETNSIVTYMYFRKKGEMRKRAKEFFLKS